MASFTSKGKTYYSSGGGYSTRKTMTVTTSNLPAKTKAPIRNVDVGSEGQDRVGGYTVVGGTGSRGGGGRIVSSSGQITPQKAQSIEQQTAGGGQPATLQPAKVTPQTITPPKSDTTNEVQRLSAPNQQPAIIQNSLLPNPSVFSSTFTKPLSGFYFFEDRVRDLFKIQRRERISVEDLKPDTNQGYKPIKDSRSPITGVLGAEGKPYPNSWERDNFRSVGNSQPFDENGKPIGIVKPALTNKELFKQSIKDVGYIKAPFYFASEKVSDFITRSKYSPVRYTGYDLPVSKLGSTTTQVAPYFTPVGSTLLFAGGIEAIGTPSGRSRIRNTVDYYKEDKGYSPTTANILGYGMPVVEAGLGAYGARSQFKNVQMTQSAKLVDQAPTKSAIYRVEKAGGGFDVGMSTKVTNPNWFQRNVLDIGKEGFVSTFVQPFKNVGTNKIIFEGGKGVTFKLSRGGNNLEATPFEVAGRGIGDGTVTGVSKGGSLGEVSGIKFKKGVEGVVSRAVIKTEETLFVTSNRIYTGAGKIKNVVKLGTKPLSTTTTQVAGFAVQKSGDIVRFVGGGLNKLKLYNTGKTSVLSNIKDFGAIKRVSFGEAGSGGFLGGTVRTTQIPKTSYAPFTPSVITKTNTASKVLPPVVSGIVSVSSPIVTGAIDSGKQLFNSGKSYVSNIGKRNTNILVTPTKPIQKDVPTQIDYVKPIGVQETIPRNITTPTTITRTVQVPVQTPKIVEVPVITPIPQPKLLQPRMFAPPSQGFGGGGGGSAFPPFLFGLPFGGERFGFGGGMSAKRSYKYTPSFKAVVFGITKKGKAPPPTKKFSGLEVRPIFQSPIKKKKKKRGKK